MDYNLMYLLSGNLDSICSFLFDVCRLNIKSFKTEDNHLKRGGVGLVFGKSSVTEFFFTLFAWSLYRTIEIT